MGWGEPHVPAGGVSWSPDYKATKEHVDQVLADFYDPPAVIDAAHIERQRKFSERTFGPGARTAGVIDHIRKELEEIAADPGDVKEWVDVIILAFDGAWRTGADPQAILDAILAKQAKNERRTWPDWRSVPEGQAVEHDRTVPED